MIKIAEKGETSKLKNYTRKIRSPFMIYSDFQSILVPKNNGRQNPHESYTNKYQIHVGCSFGYELVFVDDKFSKPFKPYLGQDDVNELIINMMEGSKYCSTVMNKHFNKELVVIKEGDENFESSAKYRICAGDHCYITGKYRCAAHRDCYINVTLHTEFSSFSAI